MEGVCFFSDGTDYVDRVKELIGMDSESDGVNLIRFNKEKALEYKEKAIEELTALGVTFPVNIDFWTSTSTSANKTAQIWKECFEDSLGTDFITFTINNYASSAAKEAYNPRLHSFLRSGWSAD